MSCPIDNLECLSETLRTRLTDAGVTTTRSLLQKCATAKERSAFARVIGVTEAQLMVGVHVADLCRVKGVKAAHACALFSAGITTLQHLVDADPTALALRMENTKGKARGVRRVPRKTAAVGEWIEDARSLAPGFR